MPDGNTIDWEAFTSTYQFHTCGGCSRRLGSTDGPLCGDCQRWKDSSGKAPQEPC